MQKRPIINYRCIADAIDYYAKLGYQYIEVPWLVSADSIDATKPPDSRYFDTFAGMLVASGEQSFIEIQNDLCPGRKYQCVTPCFRDEKHDEFHLPHFLKLELIMPLWKDDDPDKGVDEILNDAWKFLGRYGTCARATTKIGYDINMFGYELGSYGWREHKGFNWVYGTGVAEPRLSQVRQKRFEDAERERIKLEEELDC